MTRPGDERAARAALAAYYAPRDQRRPRRGRRELPAMIGAERLVGECAGEPPGEDDDG